MNFLTNVLLGKAGKITNAIGYIDTGNQLRCTTTGRCVSITTYKVAASLADPNMLRLIDAYIKSPTSIYDIADYAHFGMHLIPYNTICSTNNLMLAMDIDYMFIDDTYVESNPLIGICRNQINILHTDKCILLNKKYMKRGKRYAKHNKRQ